jgi:DNA gyrase subunit A
MNVTAKTGPVIAAQIIDRAEEGIEMVVVSQKGQVIRTDLAEVPSLSRSTQGVRIMKLREGDSIASFVCL